MHIDKVIELLNAAKSTGTVEVQKKASPPKAKPKRKASAYSKKYAKAFKSIAPKHKKKSGGWKQGGYKRAVKQAHAKAKKMR
tara:strand:- start:851 stop:1096 length:246 start_codon:yes stop_codon:yes gene_type:complete